jgi:hypothetical protein
MFLLCSGRTRGSLSPGWASLEKAKQFPEWAGPIRDMFAERGHHAHNPDFNNNVEGAGHSVAEE